MNRVRFFVSTRFPELAGIAFTPCETVRSDAPDPRRAYMHVGHIKNAICVTSEGADLSVEHLLGLTLHEFGHLATGGGDGAADAWVFREFGLVVNYMGPETLEWVSKSEARRAGL